MHVYVAPRWTGGRHRGDQPARPEELAVSGHHPQGRRAPQPHPEAVKGRRRRVGGVAAKRCWGSGAPLHMQEAQPRTLHAQMWCAKMWCTRLWCATMPPIPLRVRRSAALAQPSKAWMRQGGDMRIAFRVDGATAPNLTTATKTL
eukprot:364631-Chlamydomonas_euryale.AAC.30